MSTGTKVDRPDVSLRHSQVSECVLLVLLDGDLVQTPEHLGVAYLAAMLRRSQISCSIVHALPDADYDTVARIAALEPSLVGISLTSVNLPRARSLGRQLKTKLGSRAHLTAGGPVATYLASALLDLPGWDFLDSLVVGEGEAVICDLVRSIRQGLPPENLPGVHAAGSLPQLGDIAPAVPHLDRLPWPVRDQWEGSGRRFPYLRISTSRGCTSRCTFCNAPHAGNKLPGQRVWRGRSTENVLDELTFLHRRYGVDTFDFVDSTFEDPGGGRRGKERVRKIAQGILDRGLRIYFNICCQAVNWTETDAPLIDLLYRAGLEKVLIGVEAGSDRMLRTMKKRSTVADNRRAINLFRRHGVYVAYGFIMFHPLAVWDDVVKNARFLAETFGHNLRRFTTRLELYPGAEVIALLESEGLLHDDYRRTLSPYAYSYRDPEVERVAVLLNRLFGDLYLQCGRIGREPAVFRYETFDITLHTFFSRLRRKVRDRESLCWVDSCQASLGEERSRLAQFNQSLFQRAVEDSRQNRDSFTADLVQEVEDTYAQAISRMQRLQLRLAMRLRRSDRSFTLREAVHG